MARVALVLFKAVELEAAFLVDRLCRERAVELQTAGASGARTRKEGRRSAACAALNIAGGCYAFSRRVARVLSRGVQGLEGGRTPCRSRTRVKRLIARSAR